MGETERTQILVRMPAGLKAAIEKYARDNDWSMNAVICFACTSLTGFEGDCIGTHPRRPKNQRDIVREIESSPVKDLFSEP